jgi:mannose-6-phosphate isomerase-like protein (cupin superfamily)
MELMQEERRSFLFSAFGLGICQVLSPALHAQAPADRKGGVLGPSEGEHLVHFRDGGDVFIKFSSKNGSNHFALGTQQIKAGTGIPTHRHLQMEESFYVVKGSGTVTLDDVSYPFEPQSMIFIPINTWHSFANPGSEVVLMWIVSPAGLDGFFRETCTPPGVPPRQFTREQIRAIALKYATEFK